MLGVETWGVGVTARGERRVSPETEQVLEVDYQNTFGVCSYLTAVVGAQVGEIGIWFAHAKSERRVSLKTK